MPANYAFLAADAGVRSFSVTLKTKGVQSITATDTVTSTITGTQTAISVNAAAASQLKVTGYPAGPVAGTSNFVVVTAADAYGNTANSYVGTVGITTSDPAAILPANYTFVPADAGVHSLAVTYKTTGTRTLTATDTVTSSILGSQTGIVVAPGSASLIVASGYPSNVVAGVSNNISVTVKDAYGNIATNYVGTVRITSTDSIAVLPVNYTFVTGDAGVRSFAVTLKTSGTRSLIATDTVASSVTGTQAGIVVAPAAASSYTLQGYSTPASAGVSNSMTVVAYDPYGNIATGYLGTLRFTSTDASATLPANYTFIAGDAGTKVFSVALNTRGVQSITVTDTVTSTITATQSGILIKYYFLYSANAGNGTVSVRKITMSTGALVGSTNTAVGTAPYYLAATSDGKFLYISDYSNGRLYPYTIDPATGAITAIAGGSVTTSGPAGVTIDPTNKFLYVTNSSTNKVSGYTINATTGILTAMAGSPYTAGTGATFAVTDPTGKFLYVANPTANTISGYSINSTTGVLTALAGFPKTTGTGPQWLAFHPSGSFLYVDNYGGNQIAAYTVNSTTGDLTLAGNVTSSYPQSVVVSQGAGDYLYLANGRPSSTSPNTVTAFAINPTAGTLTSVTASPAGPYSTGASTRPDCVVIDPTGKYLYTSNYGTNTVTGFVVNSTNGTLTSVSGGPFAVSTRPSQIIVVEE